MINKKTKIIATIGPACESPTQIEKIIKAGVNITRINFSHSSPQENKLKIATIRKVSKKLNEPIALLLDTKGPEIRTHLFKNGLASIKQGSVVEIYLQKEILGDASKFSINYASLYQDVQEGSKILVDDGFLQLVVTKTSKDKITTQAQNHHVISDRRGINVPGRFISFDFLSPKDALDIKFGCEENFDYIALSFVQNAKNIDQVRKLCHKYGRSDIKIIAKIESPLAISNFDEILKASDGIMIARGDLGVEIDPVLVPTLQKQWIRKTNCSGKPVIVATQMLETMVEKPFPTRAEVSDVYNAIEDAASCVMLSGESAKGRFPVKAIETMAYICLSSEQNFDHHRHFVRINRDGDYIPYANAAKTIFTKTFDTIIDYIFLLEPTTTKVAAISRIKPCAKIIPIVTKRSHLTKWNLYYNTYTTLTNQDLKLEDEEKIKQLALKNHTFEGASILVTDGVKIKILNL